MVNNATVRTGSAALLLVGAIGFGPGLAAANAAPVPTAVAAAKPAPSTVPVSGTIADATGGGSQAFSGTLSDLTTSVVDGVLTLSGTITGNGIPGGSTTFTAPIDNVAATDGCSILNLDLGPLNLNLLGLVVDLSAISLDVTAVPGAGNLLGNLLCAVAGLLDNTNAGGVLNGIAALLNRLLTGLGL